MPTASSYGRSFAACEARNAGAAPVRQALDDQPWSPGGTECPVSSGASVARRSRSAPGTPWRYTAADYRAAVRVEEEAVLEDLLSDLG